MPHAKEKLCDVGKAIYGPTSDLTTAWIPVRHDELDTGKLAPIVAELAVHAHACAEVRTCIGYLWTNRHRMKYAQCYTQGLLPAGITIRSKKRPAGCTPPPRHRAGEFASMSRRRRGRS